MMGQSPALATACSTTRRNLIVRQIISMIMALALSALPALAAQSKNVKETDRLENAGTVLEEILNIPDNIPPDLLDKAECVVIFPSVLKFAIGMGGSFGLQLGGQATDFVLLIMNPRGAKAILSSKVKLGADMAAAAGPKGRDASANTDATMRAEILSYSRSRGLFAGISLEGSTLRPDNNANEKLYGKKVTATEIVRKGAVPVPPSAQKLVALLNKKSPKNLSDPESLK